MDRDARRRLQVQNRCTPVTEPYGAYAILLVALVLFAVGIVGSLAVMCGCCVAVTT